MDQLDSDLKRLAALAKQHPMGSRARNRMASRLLMAIEQSGRYFCPQKANYPIEVYHEALQEVRLYIFRSLETYDPTKAKMMTWVNRKLDFAFKDAIRKYLKRQANQVSLSANPYGNGNDSSKTMEDTLAPPNNTPLLSERVRQIVEEDPGDMFKQRHLRGRPEVNFQAIALKTFAGYSRREIAEIWGIQEQTLYSFYTRSCKAFRATFDQYLRD